jgi:hypothetical protein
MLSVSLRMPSVPLIDLSQREGAPLLHMYGADRPAASFEMRNAWIGYPVVRIAKRFCGARRMKRIQDKAEVSIDFPDKVYMGSFARESKFEASSENDGILIRLYRPGSHRRTVEMHLHHHLLADILTGWAESLAKEPMQDADHRKALLDALKKLEKALSPR